MSDRAVGVPGWLVASGAGLALLVVGLGAGLAGLTAAIAGSLGLVFVRARLTAQYAFVIGQVTLVAAIGESIAIGPVLLAEGLLFALLFEPTLQTADRRQSVAAAGVFGPVVGVLTWGSLSIWGRVWGAGLVVLGTGGLIGYLLHRYEYVQLGVVSDES